MGVTRREMISTATVAGAIAAMGNQTAVGQQDPIAGLVTMSWREASTLKHFRHVVSFLRDTDPDLYGALTPAKLKTWKEAEINRHVHGWVYSGTDAPKAIRLVYGIDYTPAQNDSYKLHVFGGILRGSQVGGETGYTHHEVKGDLTALHTHLKNYRPTAGDMVFRNLPARALRHDTYAGLVMRYIRRGIHEHFTLVRDGANRTLTLTVTGLHT